MAALGGACGHAPRMVKPTAASMICYAAARPPAAKPSLQPAGRPNDNAGASASLQQETATQAVSASSHTRRHAWELHRSNGPAGCVSFLLALLPHCNTLNNIWCLMVCTCRTPGGHHHAGHHSLQSQLLLAQALYLLACCPISLMDQAMHPGELSCSQPSREHYMCNSWICWHCNSWLHNS